MVASWRTGRRLFEEAHMSIARLLFLSSLSLIFLLPPAPSLGQNAESFSKLPAPQACRIIDFDKVQVVPGIVNGTWFLIVSGSKPYISMRVELSPRVYVTQPEYWGIEVVGCLGGISGPTLTPYVAVLPLQGAMGTKGIEVIGATRSEKKDISS
jgi:hypothetical protein